MDQPVKNTVHGFDAATPDLWDRILGLIEQDLEERRSRRLFVEVWDESGSVCEKEIGELSTEERGRLHPVLREHVVELLLDRHLAQQGRVDLLERRRPYTREIRELTPEDMPALIEADRLGLEEQYHRERAEFVREAEADLEQFFITELVGAAKEAQR